jgi:hypothetical protein
MPKVQTKLFRKPEDAQKAISELKAKGFKAEEMGIVGPAQTGGREREVLLEDEEEEATEQKQW